MQLLSLPLYLSHIITYYFYYLLHDAHGTTTTSRRLLRHSRRNHQGFKPGPSSKLHLLPLFALLSTQWLSIQTVQKPAIHVQTSQKPPMRTQFSSTSIPTFYKFCQQLPYERTQAIFKHTMTNLSNTSPSSYVPNERTPAETNMSFIPSSYIPNERTPAETTTSFTTTDDHPTETPAQRQSHLSYWSLFYAPHT